MEFQVSLGVTCNDTSANSLAFSSTSKHSHVIPPTRETRIPRDSEESRKRERSPPQSRATPPQAETRPVLASQSSTSTSNQPTNQRQSRPKSKSNLPENLTHTSQSQLQSSELAQEPVAIAVAESTGESSRWGEGYGGMTDEEVFKAVIRPEEVDGLEDWGIPRGVDPAECSEQLKVGSVLLTRHQKCGESGNRCLVSRMGRAAEY